VKKRPSKGQHVVAIMPHPGHLPDNPFVSCRSEADCYPTEISTSAATSTRSAAETGRTSLFHLKKALASSKGHRGARMYDTVSTARAFSRDTQTARLGR
jgi:hypothetical protein